MAMDRFEMTPQTAFEAGALSVGAEKVTAFLRKVYGWMFVGLGITAITAFAVASSPSRAVPGSPSVARRRQKKSSRVARRHPLPAPSLALAPAAAAACRTPAATGSS